MTLTQLEHIISVAQKQNFKEAAKACFVTQPSLSVSVQKLEQELQVLLFDRHKQPVVPTQIGQKIVDQAKNVLVEARVIEELVKSENDKVVGPYRLGVIPTVSSQLVPLFMPSFVKRYPEVELTILELETHRGIVELEQENIDAFIAATPLGVPGLTEQPLYLEPFLAYLPPKHPLLNLDSIPEKKLEKERVLLLSEGHCFRNQVGQICKLKNLAANTSAGPQFESGSLSTLVKLVSKGLGMTLLPYLETLEMPPKYLRPLAGKIPKREISLITRRNVLHRKIHQALSECIHEVVPNQVKITNAEKEKIVSPL